MKNFTVLFLLLISLVVFGQDKDKKTDTKPVELKVNLLIADSKNNVLKDVKQEDLRLFEDGIEQKITSFEKLNGANVGIVVDNTGSVRSQFNAIIATINTLVDHLPDATESFVVRFVTSEKISIEQDWTTSKPKLKRAISGLYVEGGSSAVLDAVQLTSEKFSEKPKDDLKRNIVILISDCEDRDSFYREAEVFESLKRNKVEVHVISFNSGLEKRSLEKAQLLANSLGGKTNGAVFFPKYSKGNDSELVKAIETILNDIQSAYRIGYISINQNPNNSERKITVEITNDSKGEKRQIFMRDKILIPK
jgi:Ca-activated chloride channel homolog